MHGRHAARRRSRRRARSARARVPAARARQDPQLGIIASWDSSHAKPPRSNDRTRAQTRPSTSQPPSTTLADAPALHESTFVGQPLLYVAHSQMASPELFDGHPLPAQQIVPLTAADEQSETDVVPAAGWPKKQRHSVPGVPVEDARDARTNRCPGGAVAARDDGHRRSGHHEDQGVAKNRPHRFRKRTASPVEGRPPVATERTFGPS